jgi:hypothetical protein
VDHSPSFPPVLALLSSFDLDGLRVGSGGGGTEVEYLACCVLLERGEGKQIPHNQAFLARCD